MKRVGLLLTCLLLAFAMAVPVAAEGTDASQPSSEAGTPPPETQHVCSFGEGTVTTAATCTAPGVMTYTCSCGAVKTEEIPAAGHSYGAASKVDDASHKSVCSACNAEASSAHSWDGGTETTKANCKQDGVKTYTCTASCGATKTEVIPKTGTHTYGDWTTTATTHSRSCTVCGAADSGNHTLKEEVVKAATCKEDGSKKKSCAACNYSETIVLTKLTTHTYDSVCDAECNVCAAKREIEHTFTKVWSKNYKGHWHECTKCGEQADFAKHIAGPAATEEKEQVCLTCGYVLMPKKNHVHSYGSEWTSDEVGHWHACTGCKEEKDYASHAFDDDCDPDCNTCGYKRENSHSYDKEGWQVSNFDHWNVCSVCGEESKHEKHVPGEAATDKAPQLCTVCGYELAPVLEHTHDFGTVYVKTQDSHWQECDCGALSVPESHTWDAGKESKKTITYTCTLCGEQKTEEAPSGSFPWLILILSLLALVCIGGIVGIVILLKKGGFEEDEDAGDEEEEDEDEDEEEKMIDDYFASIDEDIYK